MLRSIVIIIIAFMALGALAVPGTAVSGENKDHQPAFFTVLNDVPLMGGLTELPDETVAFDKAEGRIVESTAYAADTGPSEADIEAFYNQTLPHFGWQRVGTGKFMRQDEILQLDIENERGGRQVFVTIMPR